MVRQIQADAWVVIAGSGEILEWFSQSGIPTLAMFGRRQNVTIPSVGPSKVQAIMEGTAELLNLGHRRIVLITRKVRRLPKPGKAELAFLKTLAQHGVQPSDYHLPDWEETVDGFYARLESLFRISPPTAMIIDEAQFFIATQQFLAKRRLMIPQDVSLICTDYAEIFEWCRPQISHIRWDTQPVVRRVVRWVNKLSRGKADVRQVLTPAKFVRGGTIAEVKQ
jgi:LacI family transcriptional regulator